MHHFVHFLSRERKRTKRKRPCYAALRAALCFSKWAGVVELAGAQTATTPLSPSSAMLGASQRGAGQNQLDCQPFRGGRLRLSSMSTTSEKIFGYAEKNLAQKFEKLNIQYPIMNKEPPHVQVRFTTIFKSPYYVHIYLRCLTRVAFQVNLIYRSLSL